MIEMVPCWNCQNSHMRWAKLVKLLQAHRECTGTVSLNDERFKDPVAAAEELAFCKACSRFGFGLYLHHEDETM